MPRRELVLSDGLSHADVVQAHRQALSVLRSDIETAHLDALSDEPWPTEALSAHARLLSLAQEEVTRGARSAKDDGAVAVDIDPGDDGQFETLRTLAPYTINAEGWRNGRLVFSAGDTGTALWIAVTEQQESDLRSRLSERGVSTTVFTDCSRSGGRGRGLWRRVLACGGRGDRGVERTDEDG